MNSLFFVSVIMKKHQNLKKMNSLFFVSVIMKEHQNLKKWIFNYLFYIFKTNNLDLFLEDQRIYFRGNFLALHLL